MFDKWHKVHLTSNMRERERGGGGKIIIIIILKSTDNKRHKLRLTCSVFSLLWQPFHHKGPVAYLHQERNNTLTES